MLIHHFSVPFEDILTSKHNDARRWIGTIKLGKTECHHPHGLVVAKMLSHLTSVHAYQVTVHVRLYICKEVLRRLLYVPMATQWNLSMTATWGPNLPDGCLYAVTIIWTGFTNYTCNYTYNYTYSSTCRGDHKSGILCQVPFCHSCLWGNDTITIQK